MKTIIQLNTVNQFLPCTLTDEERRQRANQAGEQSEMGALARGEEDSAKRAAKAAKEKAEGCEGEAARLLGIYRKGVESRFVAVQRAYDPATREVFEVRQDTGAEVCRGKATPDEERLAREKSQAELDLDPARPRAPDLERAQEEARQAALLIARADFAKARRMLTKLEAVGPAPKEREAEEVAMSVSHRSVEE